MRPFFRLPLDPDTAYARSLNRALRDALQVIVQRVNDLSDGRIVAHDNAATSAPTSGIYKQGDFIKNSAPTELGSGGSKYVIEGWQCVASGTPGTWVEKRFLTGN